MCIRAVRYDDIYRMDEIKSTIVSYVCSIVYFVVSQNTLFMVILFHNLDDCDLYTPPRDVKGRQKQVARVGARSARTKRGAGS